MGDFPYKDPDVFRYDGPTLIVRGIKSHYVADDVLPLIGQFFPRFVVRDIDCGHWVVSERPEDFRQGRQSLLPLLRTRLTMAAVVEFLQDQDS